MSPSVREKCVEFWDTSNLKTALYHTLAYRAFSLTWASIYANLLEQKKVFLHKKRVQVHKIGLEHQHGYRFIILEH